MCRLFGLHAGRRVVSATFWLLDAPDSLAAQSRRNPDGTGLGVFGPTGEPELRKQPIAAWDDRAFHCEAQEMTGTTFLAASFNGTSSKAASRQQLLISAPVHCSVRGFGWSVSRS